jgi:asparagine synthase (glutamine-hydrolysing)
MCGIAGFVGNKSNKELFLNNALKQLENRGPDGHGVVNFGWAGLAHTRLALVDLGEGGQQPRSSEKVSIAFNGEIYNWRELRKELEIQGIHFNSDSDTEVLLKCIINFGLSTTLAKLRGIFAFAIVEEESKKVTLVRDRFGTKPLYYYFTSKCLTFGSEISALEAEMKISSPSLEEYLTFQNMTGSNTLFENIHLLEPGTFLEFNLDSSSPKISRWADVTQLPENTNTYRENLEILGGLFTNAIKRNLNADVPVGTFLSGGIDSGLIAIFSSLQAKNLNTYTIGFETENLDPDLISLNELPAAKALANHLNVVNYNQTLSQNEMWKSLEEVAFSLEEPRVGQSYPNYYASKLASKKNKAVMAGTGGDEFFGGYPWRYGAALGGLETKQNQLDYLVNFWHRLLPTEELSLILGMNSKEHKNRIQLKIRDTLEKNSTIEDRYTIRDLMYFDMKVFLHGLLIVEDKLSMRHGLEVRVPFLDEDLVNFSLTLPEDQLIRKIKGVEQVLEGKILLRDLMAKKQVGLNKGVKKGFSGPDAAWFRNKKKVMEIIGPDARIWESLDRRSTQDILEYHFNGQRNLRLLVWSLIQLEYTFRKQIG